MSRFTAWTLCCLAASLGLLIENNQLPLRVYIAIYVLIGVPMFLQYTSRWAFRKEKGHD